MSNTTTPAHDPVVGRFAAALADQHRLCEKWLREAAPDLRWQPAPGRNSIGMLLAHMAITEVWWLRVGPGGHSAAEREQEDARMRDILGLGLDDDGMPAPAGGGHPAALSGWPASRYLDLLARTRAVTSEVLRGWRDADLDLPLRVRDRDVTRGWVLYHVLEHFAQHAGQCRLLGALQPA